jgi:hypothetical protein
MKWMTIATPAFDSIETFEKVRAHVGDHTGLEISYLGTADDGSLRVVNLWESKAHADRFYTEILGPALAQVLGPEPGGFPKIVGVEVARVYSADPVSAT